MPGGRLLRPWQWPATAMAVAERFVAFMPWADACCVHVASNHFHRLGNVGNAWESVAFCCKAKI